MHIWFSFILLQLVRHLWARKFLTMEGKLCLLVLLGTFFLTPVEFGSASPVHVRLVDNSLPNAGRVEIGYRSVWKSVCDHQWTINHANVICRMLGYNQGAASAIRGMTSSDDAWLSTITCQGHETTIEQCSIQNKNPATCGHDRRGGVVCITDENPNVAIRLMNGSTPNEGRVEVRFYGVWGTVCDDRWGIADAHVVCRMLNYRKVSWSGTAKVSGSGPILLNAVNCHGGEKSLEYCQHRWGQHNCGHHEDAGVKCERLTKEESSARVRLVGSDINNTGLVEVNYNGTWRPVCDNTWVISDAHVVCKMLGYKAAYAAFTHSKVGNPGLWMSDVTCSGDETSIAECSHSGWSNTQCTGHYHAGVGCKLVEDQDPAVAVRLMNGSSPNNGRVEVRYHGVWGTVCDDGWDLADAHVVCHMLNYSKALSQEKSKFPGSGYIFLDEVHCRGNEKSLEQCRHHGWGKHNCEHGEDVNVTCAMLTQEESSVNVRIVGVEHKHYGSVEVNYNGTWRPVCDDTWDILDAQVVCRMLGYQGALAAIKRFSVGKARYWMGGVECSGDEGSISECYHNGWTNDICYGDHVAGVLCQEAVEHAVRVRLEDRSSPNSGHVAVRYGNVWGTICNRGLDINDAKVICRMLGYPGASKVYSLHTLMLEVTPIWLSNLSCNGTEKSVADCRHPGWLNSSDCNHDNDGAIICKNPDAPQFQISGTNAISESTVVLLINESQAIDSGFTSVYQVAIEKRNEQSPAFYRSSGQLSTFVFNEVNVTMAAQMGSHSYITVEISTLISSLMIGDGQYYHGYYNAPLEPGSMYRVHVRIVTLAMDGTRINGESSFVEFTTKLPTAHQGDFPRGQSNGTNPTKESSESPVAREGTSGKKNSDMNLNALIALAVVVMVLLCIFIALYLWYVLKNKKKENDKENDKLEMIECEEILRRKAAIQGNINPHFYEKQSNGGF